MRWALALSAVIGLAISQPCGAQAAATAPDSAKSSLIGVVKDSLGMPVPFASVFLDNGPATITNDSGYFRIANIPHGLNLFGVRRLGFSPLTFSVNMPPDTTVSVSIRLHQVVARLTEVTVEEKRRSSSLARAGFYERQRGGWGSFLTISDVIKRSPTRFGQILYDVLGVEVLSQNGRLIPMGHSPGGGLCRLSFFLDGHVFHLGDGEEFDVPPNEIAAIEVYPRPSVVPAQFIDRANPSCGVVVVWTRID